MPKPGNTFLRTWIGLIFLFQSFAGLAQQLNGTMAPRPYTPSPPSFTYQGLPATKTVNTAGQRDQATAACANTAFFLHLPAPAGQQLRLTDLKTMPGGDYLVAALMTGADGIPHALLMRLDNNGAIVSQRSLFVDNQDCSIDNLFVTPTGLVHLAGVVLGTGNRSYIAQLNPNLDVNWIRILELPAQPGRILVAPTEDGALAWAAAAGPVLHYGMLDPGGNPRWSRQTSPAGMTGLAAIAAMKLSSIAIGLHTETAGAPYARHIEINSSDGAILNQFSSENPVEQSRTMKTSYFNLRHLRLELYRSNAGIVTLKRHIQYYANLNEVTHSFELPGLNDFSASASMDQAGDVMGLCLPAAGRLFFIKQFAYYQTYLEHVRAYTVPAGSSLVSLTRSFDGGFLFGLNTQASDEILLLKTDSTGQLPGCGFERPQANSRETLNTQNQVEVPASQSLAVNSPVGTLTAAAIVLSGRFDCFTNTCLQRPPEDSCINSYFRVFRSNSYTEYTYNYMLLRNSRHLLSSSRYDRVLGLGNTMTQGLKLLDDQGNFIKGVNLIRNNATVQFQSHKLDDRSVMLVSNNSSGGQQRYDIALVDENLNLIWSRSINTQNEFYSLGMGISDVHKDAEGNYYLVGTTLGFGEGPKCTIMKLDGAGNLLWNRTYQWNDGLLGVAALTSTSSSVIALIQTSYTNKTSIRLDKQNGNLLNAYRFRNATSNMAAFAVYKYLFRYSDGRIFYSGDSDSEFFEMGILDTTGRPVSFKRINHPGSLIRAGTVHNGNIYATYYYYDGSGFREILLKADRDLNLSFFRQVDRPFARIHQGLQVADNGSIYVAGTQSYDPNNYDSYLIKFGPDGRLGTCSVQDITAPVSDITINEVQSNPILLARNFPMSGSDLSLAEDHNELVMAELLCSSSSNCNSLDIEGPEAICDTGTDISYRFTTNAGCTLKPSWEYDSAFVQLQRVTDSNAVFRFKKTGLIQLKARLDAGCNVYMDSIQVRVQDMRMTPALGADTTLCPGDTLRLSAGAGFSSYTWQDGSGDSVYIARGPGTYTVRVTNACGTAFTDTIILRQVSVPTLFIGNDSTLCPGSLLTLQADSGFSSYAWTTSLGTQYNTRAISYRITGTVRFSVTAKTAEGCPAADTATFSAFPAPMVNIGPDRSLCSYDSATLDAGAGFQRYRWSNGQTDRSIVVRTAGNYWIRTEDAYGCISEDTLRVNVYATPAVNLGQDRNLCTGETLVLDPGAFAQYNWQDGSSGRTLSVRQPGRYAVTVTDNRGCRGSDSFQVNTLLPLPADFLKPSISFCKYQDIELVPTQDFSIYRWSTGSRQRTVRVNRGGAYSLEVEDANGCRGKDTIQVIENDCLNGVFIPNAFTPNGDQLNDRFMALVYGKVISFRLQVYNRFGELVFSTTDPRQGWDGIFKGKDSPAGNFAWQCSYQLEGSAPAYQKGTVMLIR